MDIRKTSPSVLSAEELCQIIQTILEDRKAENIIILNLKEHRTFTDYMIIATGQSTRQVGSMAEALQTELKKINILAPVEGVAQCDWVLIDAFDVIIHLFRPEVRSYYNLEKMWSVNSAE